MRWEGQLSSPPAVLRRPYSSCDNPAQRHACGQQQQSGITNPQIQRTSLKCNKLFASPLISSASVTNIYDISRDGAVNSTDESIATANGTNYSNGLLYLAAPAQTNATYGE
jgi:hypothetical protein